MDVSELAAVRGESAVRFRGYLAEVVRGNGRYWLEVRWGRAIGYAAVRPTPGLPGVADLEGMVLPAWRRQGVGSDLLGRVMREVGGVGIRRLSYGTKDVSGPVVAFLRSHGFGLEHEEVMLRLSAEMGLRPLPPTEGVVVERLVGGEAVSRFCFLYDCCFEGQRWYQPYTPGEVVATLGAEDVLLFLRMGEEYIGFAWTRLEGEVGVVEPIGIVPKWQGRGYGRFLLLRALHGLAQQGVRWFGIGAWLENVVALGLYEDVGFRPWERVVYWAKDVG